MGDGIEPRIRLHAWEGVYLKFSPSVPPPDTLKYIIKSLKKAQNQKACICLNDNSRKGTSTASLGLIFCLLFQIIKAEIQRYQDD